ncbi:MAG: acetyl-CoA C-acyltransferase [Deltaproteobacteria bacterium]|nr:acetyl-CoA C-acyltransferase [Deltaproteobacteria bacterium]
MGIPTKTVWLIDAVRTPIGKHGGMLSSLRPDDLGALVLKAIIDRTHVPVKDIEDVYIGCANQAGEDNRNVARMSLLLAGFPVEIAGCTVNRLCGSGLEALSDAARCIMAGEGNVYIGGGVESMSRAPWVLPKPEQAFSKGNTTAYDTTLGWRLVNPKMENMGHTDSLGMTAENLSRLYNISREEQDTFALSSNQRSVQAIKDGLFKDQTLPVETKQGIAEYDEGPRADTSLEKLSKLKPVFQKDGTVTAGNSSQLSDGAAAVLLVSEDYGRAHGLKPIAKIRSLAVAGVPPRIMGIGPVPATNKAMERAKLGLNDINLIELNEAFAAQSLAVLKEWKIDNADPRLNPHGGAIAAGHPLGATGAILTTKLLHEMKRRNDIEFGLVSLCIGVGQGISMIVEKV